MKEFIYPKKRYSLDLLEEIGMFRCQPIDTPIKESLKLNIEPT